MIARFRKRHRSEFETLFAEVLKLCLEAGLVRLDVVALNGAKVKANGSLAANRTAKSLEADVAAVVAAAEKADAAEDAMFGDQRGDEMPAGLRERLQPSCPAAFVWIVFVPTPQRRRTLSRRNRHPRGGGEGDRQAKRGRKPKAAHNLRKFHADSVRSGRERPKRSCK